MYLLGLLKCSFTHLTYITEYLTVTDVDTDESVDEGGVFLESHICRLLTKIKILNQKSEMYAQA